MHRRKNRLFQCHRQINMLLLYVILQTREITSCQHDFMITAFWPISALARLSLLFLWQHMCLLSCPDDSPEERKDQCCHCSSTINVYFTCYWTHKSFSGYISKKVRYEISWQFWLTGGQQINSVAGLVIDLHSEMFIYLSALVLHFMVFHFLLCEVGFGMPTSTGGLKSSIEDGIHRYTVLPPIPTGPLQNGASEVPPQRLARQRKLLRHRRIKDYQQELQKIM